MVIFYLLDVLGQKEKKKLLKDNIADYWTWSHVGTWVELMVFCTSDGLSGLKLWALSNQTSNRVSWVIWGHFNICFLGTAAPLSREAVSQLHFCGCCRGGKLRFSDTTSWKQKRSVGKWCMKSLFYFFSTKSGTHRDSLDPCCSHWSLNRSTPLPPRTQNGISLISQQQICEFRLRRYFPLST